jgi:hypothetical protein
MMLCIESVDIRSINIPNSMVGHEMVISGTLLQIRKVSESYPAKVNKQDEFQD